MYGTHRGRKGKQAEAAMIDTGRKVEWCTVEIKQTLKGKDEFSFEHVGLQVFV